MSSVAPLHRVYLAPGLFGFGKVGSFDYFAHVKRALEARFSARGQPLAIEVLDVLPTASVRRRAAKLAELVARTAGDEGDIHLLGHSTGGLDARLVASPGATSASLAAESSWLERLRSVTTMNAPHYGTPLATFFATSRGQQALYVLSAFTYLGLSIGAGPLQLAGSMMGVFARGDGALSSLRSFVNDVRDPGVRSYLGAIQRDQGAMIQLTPEGMDLVLAGFVDRPGVVYQSTASMAPSAPVRSWLSNLTHPLRESSLALFTALHAITARFDARYPCAAMSDVEGVPAASAQQEAMLRRALGEAADLRASDGVVPIRSQLWGKLVWAGLGDHLDVLGHYLDRTPEQRPELRHHDWLTSGSAFNDAMFGSLMDAIVDGMLLS